MALKHQKILDGGKTSNFVTNLYTRKGSNSNTKKSSSTATRKNTIKKLTGNTKEITPVVPKKSTMGTGKLVNKKAAAGAVGAGLTGQLTNLNNKNKTVNKTNVYTGGSNAGTNGSSSKGTGGSSGSGTVVGSGSTATPTNNYQSLINYFKQQNEAARKSAIDAIIQRVNAQKGIYNDQMNELGGQYQALRNQSEVERYKTRNALREAQANRGQLDSGYGRQEALLMDTQYGNAINSINMQEQASRDEIKNLIAQAVAEGEADKVEVNNQYASAIQQYIEELKKGSK